MPRRTLLLLAALVFAVLYGALDVRQRARVDRGPKYHRTDFTVYQAAAQALREGTNPYEARNPRGYRYVYPPFLAVLLVPLASWTPTEAALVFYALSFVLLVLLLRGLLRLPGVTPLALFLGTLVAVPYLHESFERGQVTIALLALEGGALVFFARGRVGVAGLLLGVGGALRLTPLLPAAALGLGLLAGMRTSGAGPFLRTCAGVLGGLALGLVVVPVLALGPTRAWETNRQWVEMSRSVYAAPPGEMADLEAQYGINEYRYKNQAPRRVLSTWAGWTSGAPFERERPALGTGLAKTVDVLALAVAVAAVLVALVLGWFRLRVPGDPRATTVLSVVLLLPLLVERYAWPTHFTVLLPALVLAAATPDRSRRPSAAWLAFAVATVLFYAAHAPFLEWLGAAGPLLLGTVLLSALLLRTRRHVADRDGSALHRIGT